MRRAAPVLLVALLGLAAGGYVHDPRKLKAQKRAEARGDAWGDEWALRRKAKLNSLLRALHAVAADHTDVVEWYSYHPEAMQADGVSSVTQTLVSSLGLLGGEGVDDHLLEHVAEDQEEDQEQQELAEPNEAQERGGGENSLLPGAGGPPEQCGSGGGSSAPRCRQRVAAGDQQHPAVDTVQAVAHPALVTRRQAQRERRSRALGLDERGRRPGFGQAGRPVVHHDVADPRLAAARVAAALVAVRGDRLRVGGAAVRLLVPHALAPAQQHRVVPARGFQLDTHTVPLTADGALDIDEYHQWQREFAGVKEGQLLPRPGAASAQSFGGLCCSAYSELKRPSKIKGGQARIDHLQGMLRCVLVGVARMWVLSKGTASNWEHHGTYHNTKRSIVIN